MRVIRSAARAVAPAALLVLVLGSPAEAKYIPLSHNDLLTRSDLIAWGRIVRVREATFDVKVSAVLFGKYEAKILTIQRFRNWTCARRWAPYATGQQVLVCLQRKTDGAGKIVYRIRSGGGEGEMPIVKGQVFSRGLGRMSQAYTVHGGRITAHREPLEKVVQKIKQLAVRKLR